MSTGEFAVIGDEIHYGTVVQVRWQCPRGHFVAHDDIHSYDVVDPGEYHGIRGGAEYTCKGCSRPSDPYMYFELPRLVEVSRRG